MSNAQPVMITIDPDTAAVSLDPFWVHKHQDQYVVWECTEPFTVEFNPHDCPFYEWQFSQDAPCSGLARRNVVADEHRIYKYTVRVRNLVNDPGGGVQK
ncbi:MAG TPA: hypothetical protein VMH03_03920 [Terriglobales bacterium]|nr:hypothetical protein [Terriglobales bacterium]